MVKRPLLASLLLVIASAIAFVGLTTTRVSAGDSTVDDVTLTIPVACTLSSTLDTPHSATINNGTYTSDIGTTTFTTFCNDSEGYSIYAIGYSNETDGNNKLLATVGGVLTPSSDISTGTATSGNTSAWAMKLNPVTGTYAPTIATDTEGSYSSYHTIPSTNTKVATLTSSTDFTIGSSFQSTYRTYISPTQLSGTYNGKVKYTLVHPNYVDSQALADAITVVYDGNGLTFPNGQTANTVKYANVCSPGGYGYVGSTYQEVMTSNIDPGGEQDGAYDPNEIILQPVSIQGADKLKVVVDYEITDGLILVASGEWDGQDEPNDYTMIAGDPGGSAKGKETVIINSDTVTMAIYGRGTEPIEGYNYGVYVKIYPIYNTEQPGTTAEELPSDNCSILPIIGQYLEPTGWGDKWILETDGYETDIYDEEQILEALLYDYEYLKGSTITLTAYNPNPEVVTFDDVFEDAGKNLFDGYHYAMQDLSTSMCKDVTVGETTEVVDVRDYHTYSIGKMADGNCWMRENLLLIPTDSNTSANMSSSNTNAPDVAINNYLNGGNSGGRDGWSSLAVANSDAWPANDPLPPLIHTASLIRAAVGPNVVYYNYCAATVGTFCYARNTTTTTNASFDLCPSGWVMPDSNEYNGLRNSYNNFRDFITMFNGSSMSTVGSYNPGNQGDETDSISYIDSMSFYWSSSTKNKQGQADTLVFNNTNSTFEAAGGALSVYSYRYHGNSIRCSVQPER